MNTTTRLFIVAILVALLATSTYVLPKSLQPKSIQLPEWKLADMPQQFGLWVGADVEVEPEIRDTLLRDAESVVDRAYQDDQGNVVSLHAALFSDLDTGVRHSPINCYRGAGWRELDRKRLMLQVPGGASIPVSLTKWEREGRRVLVMYWYQLGEYSLFDRGDLLWVRWKMRGKEVWPPMVKVLLEARATDESEAKDSIQAIAREVYGWINESSHPSRSGTSTAQPPVG